MARASRTVRKIRRLKQDRKLATRMMELALKQRDQARYIAMSLEKELKKFEPFPEVFEEAKPVE